VRRARRSRGLSLVEVSVSVALIVAVLGGATALLDASESLAQSANDQSLALNRVDRVLAPLADELRKGSLASARKLDGTTFSDGQNDVGFQIRPVRGWSGTAETGDLVTIRWVRPAGAPVGDVVRSQDGVEVTLARNVTNFQVSRIGNVFRFEIAARAGPEDDRRRTASGSVTVMARNP
jgi:Tfp pilus assembly protein PilV